MRGEKLGGHVVLMYDAASAANDVCECSCVHREHMHASTVIKKNWTGNMVIGKDNRMRGFRGEK